MEKAGRRVTVRSGDCIISIADRSGLMWRTVWDHADNAGLKSERGDPMVLFPGDVVFVPAMREKSEAAATEQRHVFRRKGIPPRVRVRFMRNGEARADEPFRADVDGRLVEGATDGDGLLELFVPSTAKSVLVHLGEGDQATAHRLQVGGLDPVSEIEGINARLRNLGYLAEDPGSEWPAVSERALRAFQARQGLESTGKIDDETREALRETHLS